MVGQMVAFTHLPTQIEPLYTTYRPSLIEIIVGAGVIAYGLLGFTLGVRYLKIVDHDTAVETTPQPAPIPAPVTTD